jgi:hypothetical protein
VCTNKRKREKEEEGRKKSIDWGGKQGNVEIEGGQRGKSGDFSSFFFTRNQTTSWVTKGPVLLQACC